MSTSPDYTHVSPEHIDSTPITAFTDFGVSNELRAQRFHYSYPGVGPLDVLYTPKQSSTLFVSFHGALNRDRNFLPRFERLKTISTFNVSGLYFSDPGLFRDEELQLSWFTGWAGVDLQQNIAEIIDYVAGVAGVSSVVITGSSGGGFAALQTSALIAGSICVPFNPQTSIYSYVPPGSLPYSEQESYLRATWPESVGDVSEIDFSTDWTIGLGDRTSVLRRYADAYANRIYYAINVYDRHHHEKHFLPFESLMNGASSSIFRAYEYQGRDGHHPPSPDEFRAVISSASTWAPFEI